MTPSGDVAFDARRNEVPLVLAATARWPVGPSVVVSLLLGGGVALVGRAHVASIALLAR